MYMNAYQKNKNMYCMVDGHVPVRAHSKANPNQLDPSGVKLSCLVSPEPEEDELKFLAQMGVTHSYTWIAPHQATVEFISNLKRRLQHYDIILYIVGMLAVGKSSDIILGTEKKDQKIAEFVDFLEVLHKAGVFTTIFTCEPASALQTGHNEIRGGAQGRFCSEEVLKGLPLAFGREYTEEELWENMGYFLKRVIPAVEKLGMTIAFHPNDPPSDIPFRGIPNLIRNVETVDRMFELGASPCLKMEFCCGCWLEAGDKGGNLLTTLRRLIREDKVINIHLRNVTETLPAFTEVFLDEGYGDIAEIIRLIVEENYRSTLILDHCPEISGGKGLETAFSIGYIKAMVRTCQKFKKEERTDDLTACLKADDEA
ncbi:Mannonate dehydratase 2 [Diplonema papillatum]|nr:Mannonate dehydratase 2 [Diplonema papillatum]